MFAVAAFTNFIFIASAADVLDIPGTGFSISFFAVAASRAYARPVYTAFIKKFRLYMREEGFLHTYR